MRSQRLPFLALATTLGLALTACGGSAGESSGEGVLADDKVTIGVVGTDPTHDALQRVAEEQGITVEYVDFSDYNQPNPATESGDVEMTWFQHVPFLADYNNAAGGSMEITEESVSGKTFHRLTVDGGVSADGQHGYTLGYLEIEGGDPNTAKRRYLAYWTRGADGWRVAT